MNTDDLPVPDLPDLELDEAAFRAPAPAAGPSFRVQVGPVRDPVEVAPELVAILGVDLATAQRIAVNAPGVIVSGAARDTAERIARQVEALGIKARVEEDGASERPISVAPGRGPSDRPAPPSSVRPPEPAPRRSSGPGDGFWVQTPVAFVAPFLGKGSLLLAATGLTGVGVGLMAVLPGLCMKIGFLIGLQLVALGLFVETFNRLAQAAIYRDDDSLLPEPVSDLPQMSTLFWRGVVNFFVFALLAAPGILVAIYARSVSIAIACQVALFLYWPMALTVQSVSGRLTGPFDVVSVLRAMVAAPLEYLVVCVLTIAAIAGSVMVVIAVTGVSAVGAQAMGGNSIGTGATLLVIVSFVWYAAIAYFHGVLGYLMGALVRSKGDAFDFLSAD